jgi:outer membrane protein OmpA-like peptidoglycan-associated protein
MTCCLRMLVRLAAACAVAVLVACASQPTQKSAALPAVAHGAVSSTEQRAEKSRVLVQAGVTPLQIRAVPAYLHALEARLRPAVAGNTAQLVRVDSEVVVVLPTRVLFVPDAVELTPAGGKFLAALANTLGSESALLIEATCHTDRLGSAADNESFSARRAELVRATLTAGGIDPRRLMAIGSGAQFPIAGNATADGRRLNRRVELSLIPITR